MLSTLQRWNIISLRYFNPVGAHPSGRIGEDPTKNFSNLMPYIAQVALGNKPHVEVFGGDYNTPDGTGGRLLQTLGDRSGDYSSAQMAYGANESIKGRQPDVWYKRTITRLYHGLALTR